MTPSPNTPGEKHLAPRRLPGDRRGTCPRGQARRGREHPKNFQDLLHFIDLSDTKNAGPVVYAFLEKTGYLKRLVESGSRDAELKIKNIRLFFDRIKNSPRSRRRLDPHLRPHLDLLQDVGDNPATAEADLDEDAVNILTVHKAKGLEFEVVFMVGLIADRFPGREKREKIRSRGEIPEERLPSADGSGTGNEASDIGALREERRLFYVGMTRAKRELYLTWAKDYGLKRLKKVSPFVLEALDIPKQPEEVQRTSALEEISRYGQGASADRIPPRLKVKDILSLSYFQVEDHQVCPLKIPVSAYLADPRSGPSHPGLRQGSPRCHPFLPYEKDGRRKSR